jgi:type III pantothenate kinase
MNGEPIILACDIGNSRIGLACVQGEQVLQSRRLSQPEHAELADVIAELWESCACRVLAASSVNPGRLAQVEAAAGERIKQELLLVGRDLPLPIRTDVEEPNRVGTDRLCCAAMAYERLGQACVVASFGTAITVDCVDNEGVFLGGAILPGLRLSAAALAGGTALLPKVELHRPDWVFGKNTMDAIIGGIVYGARGAMRELTEAYGTALGHWPPLILTGGDAELVGAGYDIVHAIVPDLCLLGVGLTWRKTRPSPS